MTPTQLWITGTGLSIIVAIVVHSFYFGRLLGRISLSLEHIEQSLARNDKEHDDMWARINHTTDTITQHIQIAGGRQ